MATLKIIKFTEYKKTPILGGGHLETPIRFEEVRRIEMTDEQKSEVIQCAEPCSNTWPTVSSSIRAAWETHAKQFGIAGDEFIMS